LFRRFAQKIAHETFTVLGAAYVFVRNYISRMGEPEFATGCSSLMRYSIRQSNMQGELWLVRTTKKGVWGAQERACAFFRRPTAVRWVERLAATNPGITLDVIEFDERTLSVPLDAPKPDEASRAGSADVAEEDVGLAPVALLA